MWFLLSQVSFLFFCFVFSLKAQEGFQLISGSVLEKREGRSLAQLCRNYGGRILVYYSDLYYVTKSSSCVRRNLKDGSGSSLLSLGEKFIPVDGDVVQAIPRGLSVSEKEMFLIRNEGTSKESLCRKHEGRFVPLPSGHMAKVENCRLRIVVSQSLIDEKIQKGERLLVLSPHELEQFQVGIPLRGDPQKEDRYWDVTDRLLKISYDRSDLWEEEKNLQEDNLKALGERLDQFQVKPTRKGLCQKLGGHWVLYYSSLFFLRKSTCTLEPHDSSLSFFVSLHNKNKKIYQISSKEYLLLPVKNP